MEEAQSIKKGNLIKIRRRKVTFATKHSSQGLSCCSPQPRKQCDESQSVNVDNQALPVSPLAQINFGTSQIFRFLRSRFGLKFGRVRREQNLCPSVFAANYRACRDMAGDRPD